MLVGWEEACCSAPCCSPRGNISLCNTGMIYVDPRAWPFAISHVKVSWLGCTQVGVGGEVVFCNFLGGKH